MTAVDGKHKEAVVVVAVVAVAVKAAAVITSDHQNSFEIICSGHVLRPLTSWLAVCCE